MRRLCGPRLAASWNKRTTGTSCFHGVDGWRRTWSTTGVFDDNAWPVPARCSHSRHHCTFVSRPIATPSAEGERRCIYASSHAVETFARFLWASLSRCEFVAFGASFWSVQAGRFLHRLAATVPLARRRRTRSLTRIAHDQRRGASSLRRLRRADLGRESRAATTRPPAKHGASQRHALQRLLSTPAQSPTTPARTWPPTILPSTDNDAASAWLSPRMSKSCDFRLCRPTQPASQPASQPVSQSASQPVRQSVPNTLMLIRHGGGKAEGEWIFSFLKGPLPNRQHSHLC